MKLSPHELRTMNYEQKIRFWRIFLSTFADPETAIKLEGCSVYTAIA